jgi:hypothetical protein
VTARLLQADEVQTPAVVVLGRARDRATDGDAPTAPQRLPWNQAAAPMPLGHPPVFTQHFEYRSTGPLPISGAAEAHTAGWVRARDPGAPGGAAFVVAMADAWWPALYSRLDEVRPMATLAFTLDFCGELDGIDLAAPFFHDARALATRDGYSTELRALYAEDGRLVSLNHQTFVVVK